MRSLVVLFHMQFTGFILQPNDLSEFAQENTIFQPATVSHFLNCWMWIG